MAKVPGFTVRYGDGEASPKITRTRGVPWRVARAAADREIGRVAEDARGSGEIDPSFDAGRTENGKQADPTLGVLAPEQVSVVDALLKDCEGIGFEDACEMDDTAPAVQDWLNGWKTLVQVTEIAEKEEYNLTVEALANLLPASAAATPPGQ